MIKKTSSLEKPEKINSFMGITLFLISVFLITTTGPFGLVFGILHSLLRGFPKGIGNYFLRMSVAIDQLGNVVMQHLLNVIWIKEGGYKFGRRETISSVLGKNFKTETLTKFGIWISKTIDKLEPNHSLNSIEYIQDFDE